MVAFRLASRGKGPNKRGRLGGLLLALGPLGRPIGQRAGRTKDRRRQPEVTSFGRGLGAGVPIGVAARLTFAVPDPERRQTPDLFFGLHRPDPGPREIFLIGVGALQPGPEEAAVHGHTRSLQLEGPLGGRAGQQRHVGRTSERRQHRGQPLSGVDQLQLGLRVVDRVGHQRLAHLSPVVVLQKLGGHPAQQPRPKSPGFGGIGGPLHVWRQGDGAGADQERRLVEAGLDLPTPLRVQGGLPGPLQAKFGGLGGLCRVFLQPNPGNEPGGWSRSGAR
jgi:hypothetical protein